MLEFVCKFQAASFVHWCQFFSILKQNLDDSEKYDGKRAKLLVYSVIRRKSKLSVLFFC